MKICAVVPTFNKSNHLKMCLDALLKQTRQLNEIIVIDNGSTDMTKKLVKEKYPFITYLQLKENTGSAGGFSAGMKLAYQKGYDWIWLMDNDAVPLSDALEILLNSELIKNNAFSILCCAVYNSDSSIGKGHRVLFDNRNMSKVEVDQSKYNQSFFKVDLASYTGQLVSRKVIDKINFPMQEFFVQWDDFDYSLRLKNAGGNIFVIPSSKLIHDVSVSTTVNRQYYLVRNKIYVCKKYFHNGLAFNRFLVSLFFIRIVKIFLYENQKLLRLKILFYAFRDAFQERMGKYQYD